MPPGEGADNPPMAPSVTEPGQPGTQQNPGDPPKTGDSKKPKTGQAKPKTGENPPEGEPMPAAPGEMPPEGGEPGAGQGAGGGPKPEGADAESPAEAEPGEGGKPPKPAPENKPAPKGPKKPGQGNQPSQGGEPSSGDSPTGAPPAPGGAGEGKSPSSGGPPGQGAKSGPPQDSSAPPDTGTPAESVPLNSPDEAVNLENRKKAAALAIKQLQEEMSRGETPQDLLDKLGYTEEELDAFLKQLDQNLNKAGDESSPEAQARRRQFDELLKGVELDSPGELKSGGEHERQATQSSGSNRRPTPPKYKSADEAYKKRLQKAP